MYCMQENDYLVDGFLGGIFKVFMLRCQNLSANRYEINTENRTQVSPSNMVTVALFKKFWNVTLKKKKKSLQEEAAFKTPRDPPHLRILLWFLWCPSSRAECPVPARYSVLQSQCRKIYQLMLSVLVWTVSGLEHKTVNTDITNNSFKQVYIQRHFLYFKLLV